MIIVGTPGNDTVNGESNVDTAIVSGLRPAFMVTQTSTGVFRVVGADGTAYLRAIMEADGNIRYANYQSQQEVIDYLAANGFGQETWGTWFNHPADGDVSLMQERVDLAEANGLGRAQLTAFDAPLPGCLRVE